VPIQVLGDELPLNAFQLLHDHTTNAVLATVDENGYPRTAPFGLICAINRKTLRVGMNAKHRTYANILRDGKVMVCVMDADNISLGIRGDARVIKEGMDSIPWRVGIIEIAIVEVKSDAITIAPITRGIQVQVADKVSTIFQKARDELLTYNVS
jgi:hypothetical protein